MAEQALKKERIAVLMGGPSAEREVSLQTGQAVAAALAEQGFEQVVELDVDRRICGRLLDERVDRAFIALHGRFGEDGCIQGLLETLRIAYTGSGVLASAMAMDKVITKRLLGGAGLPTPAWAYPASAGALEPSVVLKPRAEGSSIGVHIAADDDELLRILAEAGDGAAELLAERYVPGRELSVAIIGEGDEATALGAIEIRAAEGFYDYQAKYERDDTEYLVEPQLPEHVARRMTSVALSAHRLLECSGVTRIDFRYDGEAEPLLLEVNTVPGLTAHSLVPKIAERVGISYGQLVERMIADAKLRA